MGICPVVHGPQQLVAPNSACCYDSNSMVFRGHIHLSKSFSSSMCALSMSTLTGKRCLLVHTCHAVAQMKVIDVESDGHFGRSESEQPSGISPLGKC